MRRGARALFMLWHLILSHSVMHLQNPYITDQEAEGQGGSRVCMQAQSLTTLPDPGQAT